MFYDSLLQDLWIRSSKATMQYECLKEVKYLLKSKMPGRTEISIAVNEMKKCTKSEIVKVSDCVW